MIVTTRIDDVTTRIDDRIDDHYNNDTFKYPITVVNLYTQELPGIFRRVNTQLLQGHVEEIWQI